MNDLESLTPAMDDAIDNILGESITYRVNGGPPIYPKAHVNYGDAPQDLGAGVAIEQDITLSIRKISLPTMPNSSDRITLGKRPGKVFKPVNPSDDDSGYHWIVKLREVK